MQNITQKLIHTCLHLLPQQIGETEINAARKCLVDSLATALTAYQEEPINILRSLTIEPSAQGQSTVIGYGEKSRPADVALVNGTMISLQLFDDNQAEMRGHPSGPLLPAVLALAELNNQTIDEALKAFVIGYEVECRLGTLINPSHYEMGWHATATQGTLAAVVASGIILKLSDEQMAHALGIVTSMMGGVRRNFGTMTMSMHSGMAASNGVRAAQLAQKGFTGDPKIFDGPMNLCEVFSREWTPNLLEQNLNDWGKPFMIVSPGATFKLYPCGRPPLFAVDCALAIQERHHILPKDIKKIRCDVSFLFPRTLIHTHPTNGLQAKASLQYCIATSLLDGRPTLHSFSDAMVNRPEITSIIDLIEVNVPPHLSEDIPAVRKAPFAQPVTLVIETHDGQIFSETVPIHKGSPKNPASEADLKQKFIDCAKMHMSLDRAQQTLAYMQDGTHDIRTLMQLVTV